MTETIILLIIVLLALLILSVLMGLYVRRFDRPDFIIAIYVTFVLLSQLLATKLVFFDIGFTAPAGVILFPFTFQLTDTINEKFGRKETQKAILIAFVSQIIMVFFFLLSTSLPGIIASSSADNAVQIWNSVFGFTLSITIASWIAFLISENLDAYVYQGFKNLTGGRKHLWLRNAGSDAISVVIDSLIFAPLAFFLFPLILQQGELPIEIVIDIIIGQIIMKLLFGLLDTPFLYLTRWLMYGELDERFPFLTRFSPSKN